MHVLKVIWVGKPHRWTNLSRWSWAHSTPDAMRQVQECHNGMLDLNRLPHRSDCRWEHWSDCIETHEQQSAGKRDLQVLTYSWLHHLHVFAGPYSISYALFLDLIRTPAVNAGLLGSFIRRHWQLQVNHPSDHTMHWTRKFAGRVPTWCLGWAGWESIGILLWVSELSWEPTATSVCMASASWVNLHVYPAYLISSIACWKVRDMIPGNLVPAQELQFYRCSERWCALSFVTTVLLIWFMWRSYYARTWQSPKFSAKQDLIEGNILVERLISMLDDARWDSAAIT